jgi:hypothetical protein
VAKTDLTPQDQLALEDLEELELLGQNSIQNRNELISIHSNLLNRTVTVTRDQIYKYASVMASNTQIASLIGVDKSTIGLLFAREIKMGRAFAKQKLLTRFYNLAVYGNNPSDRIFALKNWAGMSDTGMDEQFEDLESGIDFKVRRPTKPHQQMNEIEDRENRVPSLSNLEQEFQNEKP